MAGGVETGSSCVTLRISIAMDGVLCHVDIDNASLDEGGDG